MYVATRTALFLGALALAMGIAWQSQAGTFNAVKMDTFRNRNTKEAARPFPTPHPQAIEFTKAQAAEPIPTSTLRERGLAHPATPTPLSAITAGKAKPLSAYEPAQPIGLDEFMASRRYGSPR